MYDTTDNVGDVPNQPRTPASSFRLGDELTEPLKELATARGVTVTDVVREALREYLAHLGMLRDEDA